MRHLQSSHPEDLPTADALGLLVRAHEGAPGWPALLTPSQQQRHLAPLLRAVLMSANHAVAAWQGQQLLGLLLADYPSPTARRCPSPSLRQLIRCLVLPRPLQRLLRDPIYARQADCHGYVLAVCVAPEWQRRGIGRDLIRTLTGAIPAMPWLAHTDHAGSRRLFVSSGFEPCEQSEQQGLIIDRLTRQTRPVRKKADANASALS